jgi:radial spoke head protein 3
MAAYSFNSEPRVVSTRSEKYKPEDRMSMNLMYDKRVFRGHVHDIHNIRPVLSPQEQEELHLQKEKEKKRDEMMKRQMDAFKKNKYKQSPYDIRPAATGRIEVDLQYFLTDQRDIKPDSSEVLAQTDDFVTKASDPPYVPKKTGRDVITQIEDGDLFSFDVEVRPILSVVISKTLEQALLEVEEESEMDSMQAYKAENHARKLEEEKSWAHMVKEEAEKIQKKNTDVQIARNKYVKTMQLATKFHNLNIAKHFLAGLVPKVLDEVTGAILTADNFENLLSSDYLPFVLEGTDHYLAAKHAYSGFIHQESAHCAEKMKTKRTKLISQHKQKAKKEQIRNINYSNTQRLVRVLYNNPSFYVQSEFTMRLSYVLRGDEYPENVNDSILMKDAEKKEDEEAVAEEKKDAKPDWAKNLTFLVDDIRRFGFALAHHPSQDTPKDMRKYGILAEFYSETGELIGTVDSASSERMAGARINTACRDMTKKASNDEVLVLAPQSLSKEVHHVFLYLQSVRPLNTEFKYAKYQLVDFETSQKIDGKAIKPDEFTADGKWSCVAAVFGV